MRLGFRLIILVFLGSFLLGKPLSLSFFKDDRRPLVIAAGQATGEAFEMASAIAEVAKRHEPELQIDVLRTAGSVENIDLLQDGQVSLATVQADAPTWPSARLVAVLYHDEYQLVVREESSIRRFGDLRGRKIALPPLRGGQFHSFWMVAHHFGLTEGDLEYVTLTTKRANAAFLNGEVDAVFRVRAPRSRTLLDLFQQGGMRLVPIEQGNALRLQNPAIEPGIVPRGAYRGDPPMPLEDVETLAVQRLLLAHEDISSARITALTRLLFERRQDLLNLTPLAAHIKPPMRESGTFLPVHRGAQQFFDRGEPSFWQEHVEIFAFGLSVLGIFFSTIWSLKSIFERSSKSRADRYNRRMIEIGHEILGTRDLEAVREQRRGLFGILERVVHDLDHGRVSAEGFHYFSFTWEAVHWLASDRESDLMTEGVGSGESSGGDTENVQPPVKGS